MTAFHGLASGERAEREEQLSNLKQKPDELRICQRVFGELRRNGIYCVVKLRHTCELADTDGTGLLRPEVFQGILTIHGILLLSSEQQMLQRALHVQDDVVSYARFFDLMEGVGMSEERREEVKKAYSKLHAQKRGRSVTVDDLMDTWNPSCYPDVQAGRMTPSEAFQDFFNFWTMLDADGCVSSDTFFGYYRGVSMYFTEEQDFVKMMRTAWGT